MANLALYRKYRPKTFGEVIGQEHAVQTLKNALIHGLLSHAYVFAGPRGSGKTTIARLLAKAVNCPSTALGINKPKGEPCNACDVCQEINAGNSLDLVEIDAASHRGIDEIRELKEGVAFLPARLKYKVFIIDEAHQLTKEAVNALLKTLEEPPPHAIFILATTEIHKMLPTIVSRCQRFDFRRLKVPEIVQRLAMLAKNEKAPVEQAALGLIAMSSGGSLRDAEGLLDKVLTFHAGFGTKKEIDLKSVEELLGIVDLDIIGAFIDLISARKAPEAVDFLNTNLEKGIDPIEFSKNLLQYLRYLLIVKISPKVGDAILEGFAQEQKEKIQTQAKQFEETQLQKTTERFMEAENQMKYASIIQLPLELAIIDSCGFEK